MADAKKLHLQITAGPSYDASTHQLVPVNTETPLEIHSEHLDAQVNVRIQNYRGLPSGSPSTCEYFSQAPHQSDLYSISFGFNLKKSIPGTDLLFGNDFEFPIRDRLPPGFSTALRIVKWGIDPGLDGDVYADKPYLYGALASSINTMWVGDERQGVDGKAAVGPLEEGGSEAGKKLRAEKNVPDGGAHRMKHFLTESHRKDWTFEAGREYRMDFFNPYLDFNDLALKLPGNFKLHLMSFWDGQPLRYSLKHRTKDASVDELLFVVVISLIPEDKVESAEQKLKEENKTKGVTEHDEKEPGKKPEKESDKASETKAENESAAPAAESAKASGTVGGLGLDMAHAAKDFSGLSGGGAVGGAGPAGGDDGSID